MNGDWLGCLTWLVEMIVLKLQLHQAVLMIGTAAVRRAEHICCCGVPVQVSGTPERPRLAVHRSNNHIYAQVGVVQM
jgi:ribosomal protein L18